MRAVLDSSTRDPSCSVQNSKQNPILKKPWRAVLDSSFSLNTVSDIYINQNSELLGSNLVNVTPLYQALKLLTNPRDYSRGGEVQNWPRQGENMEESAKSCGRNCPMPPTHDVYAPNQSFTIWKLIWNRIYLVEQITPL